MSEDEKLPENEWMQIDARDRARVNAVGKLNAENVSVGDRIEGQRRVLEYSIDPIAPNQDLETWVDRTQIQSELIERLKAEPTRLVELVASGGFGKSLLAAWATQQVENEFEWSLWINFSDAPSFNAFGRWVNQEIGFLIEETITDDDLINQTIYRLSQRRCLVVMDQLEAIADDDATMPTFETFLDRWQQRGRKSAILITTRQQFCQARPRGYDCLLLPGFSGEEGAAFLTKKGITTAQAEALSQLSDLAEGHPLSLNLAAGWLQETSEGKLSEQDLVFFQRLFEQNIGDLDAQVKEIFNELLERLASLIRDLLLEVVVYRQPFDLSQAQAMQPTATEQDLHQLESKGFLLLKEARWTLHPLVREFVMEAASAANSDSNAHQKAADFFSARLTADKTDLQDYLECFHHSCELGDYEAAYDVIQKCGDWLSLQGHYRLLVEINERLVAEWPGEVTELESQRKFGDVLNSLGNAYNSLGQYERAIDFQKQSLNIKREIGDRNGEATALVNLGSTYSFLGQYERAIDFQQQALSIQREIGDRYGEAVSLFNRATAYAKLDDHWPAREGYEQARAIFTDLELDHMVKKCEKAIQERNRIIAMQPKKAPTIGPEPKTNPNDWREKSMPIAKPKTTPSTANPQTKNTFSKWLPYIALFVIILGLILLLQ